MENLDIRLMVEQSGLKYQKIADEMGVSPSWLCRLMRKKLSINNQLRIMSAINKLTRREDIAESRH